MLRTRLLLVTAVTGVLALLAVPLAAAAPDTRKPTLLLPKHATFVAGSTIGPMQPGEAGTPEATDDIVMTANWSATDASGICGYSTRESYAGGIGKWSPWSGQTSVTRSTTDYEDQQGGGTMKFEGYDVRVRDCAGNITRKFVRFFPVVFQENGQSYGYGTLPVSYTGTWGTSKCLCWSGGTTRKTSAAGATMTFTVDLTRRQPVALVMEKAANRGKAQVFVDGVLRGTVDTYADPAAHRSVVWVRRLPPGFHTVTVVNLATPGRPRIDIDAVMVSGRYYLY